ncbi:MAG: cytidylate kinase [Parcubacteria group bacterium SW_6_46_9]|nr:MAG: cytidylate kinase [Parcubacteria group bacterium SW_6_46_9]
MKPKIITISGPPGSGTTTVSRNVSENLDYSRFASGDFMRNLARERGISLQKLIEKAENNPEIDRKIDAKVQNLADGDELVVDSRLAFHFIPESFAVYLEVNFDNAAQRVYEDKDQRKKNAERDADSIKETKKQIIERLESERERYKNLYNIDHTNHTHYDLIIRTDDKTVKTITNIIIREYKSWLKQ